MAKVAMTVRELIEKLSDIDNKDLEVWIRGDDKHVIPCDEISKSSGDEQYLVLSNHIGISMDDILKSLQG